jgi:predicted dehydrogenase
MESLQAGKHVLVAKPLATSSEEARRLDDEATKRHLTLMVGHTFVYSGAVRKIRQILAAGELGEVLYYDSVRVNLGVFQPDVNVLWDLAVHDLSILDFLLDEQPEAVSATGIRHLPGQLDNLACLTLFYPGSMIAHLRVSWVAPVKERRIHIGGSRRMIVYDDTETEGKVCVYDKGFAVEESSNGDRPRVTYRQGSMAIPELDASEPLSTETSHFIDCIVHQRPPLTGARSGLRIVTILEAATCSLEQRGRLIELPQLERLEELVSSEIGE